MRYILFPLFACFFTQMQAQQELMLHQSTNFWQANSLNPALFPAEKRFAVGLPGYGLDITHSGNVPLGDVLRKENGQNVIDLGQLIPLLADQNTIYYDQTTPTLSFGMKLPGGKWAVNIGHATRYTGVVKYQKSLAELWWNGNAPFVGQEVSFAPTVNGIVWNEIGVGISREISMVTVGARIKYLSGVGALQSDESHKKMSVYTDPDFYQLTLKTDYGFHSSLFLNSIDTSGLGYTFSTEKLKKGRLFSKNQGLAYDFGITAKLTDRIQVSASVLDVGGKITWEENAAYFKSNGEFKYNGIKIPGEDIFIGSDSLDISSQLDTINDIFQFQKTATTFSTPTPMRIYAGGTVKITEKWSAGLSIMHQKGDTRNFTAGGINVEYRPIKWLSIGAMYAANDRSKANLGLSLRGRIGPVHLFAASDNLIKSLDTNGSPAINLRAGGSVQF